MRKVWILFALALAVAMLWPTPGQACRIIDPRPIIIIEPPMPQPRPVEVKPMETRSHLADIAIDGQAASVNVEAVFFNPNGFQIEGTYFFPLPANVAVSQFAMVVNGKEMKGELLDAQKARQVYEDIVRRLKDPGLLEFVGMQMIKVRVFPILPNAEVKVKLAFQHLVEKDAGMYMLRYPLSSAMPADRRPVGQVTLKVNIASRIALKNIYSPTHAVDKTLKNDLNAVVGFEAKNVLPDRDFILYWSEAEEDIGANLLTHRPVGESGYFMLMLSPKVEIAEAQVAAKDVVFVLDRSGSMQENGKIDQAKGALRYCVQKLNERDRFNLVTFSTTVTAFRDSLIPASQENIQAALAFIDKIEAAGGTAIDEALETALKMSGQAQGLPMILFLTDGLPTVGETDVERILKNARERNAKAARIFAFGVGFDVNAHLLDRLAEEGRGARDYVKPQENIELKVSNLYTKVASPVLSDVEVFYDGVKVEDVYPKKPADIFRGSQLILLGRFEGQGEQSLRVRGKLAGQEKEYVYRVAWGEKAGAPFMPTLWAMRKVGYLLDEIRLRGASQELVDEVTRLGKKYGIVTPYTSFLVVDDGALPPPVQSVRPPPGHVVPLPGPIVELEEARKLAKEAREAAARDFAEAPAAGERAQSASRAAGRLKGDALGAGAAPTLDMADAEEDAGFLQAARAKARERGGAAADRLTRAPIKRIEGKTFIWQEGLWIDTEYAGGNAIAVEFLSEEYFALLKSEPDLAKFLAAGDNMIVCWKGKVYQVKSAK